MGNKASKPAQDKPNEASIAGRALNMMESAWNVVSFLPRYGIRFWGGAYSLVRLLMDGNMDITAWPNEVKWVFFVLAATSFGFVYLGLSPFISIPEKLLGWLVYLQYELFVDVWEFSKWTYYSITSYFGVDERLAMAVGSSWLAFVLIGLTDRVARWALLNHEHEDEWTRTYDVLCYPITFLLHHMDPAFFTQRDSKFPWMSYAYDWFCAALIFPWQLLAALATPVVMVFWTPENSWVAGRNPIIDKLTDRLVNL